MSITSNRRIINEFSGDFTMTAINAAAESTDSPGSITNPSLVTGPNTITKPEGAVGVTIIMPEDNEVQLLLKKVTGDTGIALHLTDPTSLALDDSVTSFVLTAADDLDGVRLIWS